MHVFKEHKMCLNERAEQMDNNAIVRMQPVTVYESFFDRNVYVFHWFTPNAITISVTHLGASLTICSSNADSLSGLRLDMVICPALRSNDLKSLAWWAFEVLVSAFSSPSHSDNNNNNVGSECSIWRLSERTDVTFWTVLTSTGIFLLSQYAQLSGQLWKKWNKTKRMNFYLRMLWQVQTPLASMALQSFTLAVVLNSNPQGSCACKKNLELAKCHASISSALRRFCPHHEPSWCQGHNDIHKLALKLSETFQRHNVFTRTAWHRTDIDCTYKIIHPFKHFHIFCSRIHISAYF